jgi:hypothetical protein
LVNLKFVSNQDNQCIREMNLSYDIIGDIHGHAEALKALLSGMGYRESRGAWRHPARQALFVGDFIDRGPKQLETVDIVRRMVDSGSAQAVMGNHEFNAIAWFLPDPDQPGEYMRPHHSPRSGNKNFRQHEAFLNEAIGTPRHKEVIDWFLTLPLWLDLDEIRVVHACWHQPFIDDLAPQLASGNRLSAELMVEASREPAHEAEKDTPDATIFKALEALTKGIETPLPDPHCFVDKDGHKRHRVRTSWWESGAASYRQAALLDAPSREALPDEPIPDHIRIGHDGGKPLFIGHYWKSGKPDLLSDKVACVDYSIAKGGKLVAYRWDGEPVLDRKRFCWAGEQQ